MVSVPSVDGEANFVVEIASGFTPVQVKSKVVHTRPMETLIRMEV